MVKRLILMLTVAGVFLGALGFVKFRQIQTAIAQGAAYQPPPEAITTIVATAASWPSTLKAVGTVAAVQGVTVSADLAGTVERIAFESGQTVRAGDVLVELNTTQERAQLASAEADRDLAKLNFDRMRGLLDQQVVSKAEFDRADAARKQADARVSEVRAVIERKTIRAPFAGVLGLRDVNLGQYLKDGQRVTTLQSLSPIYVNFSVPQQVAAEVRAGRQVRITTDGTAASSWVGRVTALDSVVNEQTRNVQVQATLDNTSGALRPGMFVQAEVGTGAAKQVIALPASAVSYAPYGNSVFVVTDMKNPAGQSYKGVRQQFVTLGETRGDQIAILSGLAPGDEVATSGVFKLRPGVAVSIDNAVQPGNNPKAKPEER
jgi:membrane fusion protein (multidrug efflux system)